MIGFAVTQIIRTHAKPQCQQLQTDQLHARQQCRVLQKRRVPVKNVQGHARLRLHRLDVSICQDDETADINRLAELSILRAYSIEQSAPRDSGISVSHWICFGRRLKIYLWQWLLSPRSLGSIPLLTPPLLSPPLPFLRSRPLKSS